MSDPFLFLTMPLPDPLKRAERLRLLCSKNYTLHEPIRTALCLSFPAACRNSLLQRGNSMASPHHLNSIALPFHSCLTLMLHPILLFIFLLSPFSFVAAGLHNARRPSAQYV